jgi:hypothetical protein
VRGEVFMQILTFKKVGTIKLNVGLFKTPFGDFKNTLGVLRFMLAKSRQEKNVCGLKKLK